MRRTIIIPAALCVSAAAAVLPTAASAQRLEGYVGSGYPGYSYDGRDYYDPGYRPRGYYDDRRADWIARERWEHRERWEREQARRRHWEHERREHRGDWYGDDND